MRGYPFAGLVALAALLGGAFFVLGKDDGATESDTVARTERTRATPGEHARERGDDRRDDPDLESRVAKLENEVATLRRQLVLTGGGRPIADALDRDSEADEAVASPQLDTTVREIVADEREREREERWQRRSDQAMERITEAAALSDEQQTAIAALWETERERITPVFMEARAGDKSFEEASAEVDAIRLETDTEAKKVLSAGQLEAYDEHRPRGPGGRREGRDGRGPPG